MDFNPRITVLPSTIRNTFIYTYRSIYTFVQMKRRNKSSSKTLKRNLGGFEIEIQ